MEKFTLGGKVCLPCDPEVPRLNDSVSMFATLQWWLLSSSPQDHHLTLQAHFPPQRVNIDSAEYIPLKSSWWNMNAFTHHHLFSLSLRSWTERWRKHLYLEGDHHCLPNPCLTFNKEPESSGCRNESMCSYQSSHRSWWWSGQWWVSPSPQSSAPGSASSPEPGSPRCW